MKEIIGKKGEMKQIFSKEGERFPVTEIIAGPCRVAFERTKEKDGYSALGLAWEPKKKKSFLKEIRIEAEERLPVGEIVTAEKVFQAGDLIDVRGKSKGLGFAGVVKRHHFKGGPQTHGQSDRERAPGSIGSTTTPGRVMKGKRMAGKEGDKYRTVKNLLVVTVDKEKNKILVKGAIPGKKNDFVILKKVGNDPRFKAEII